MRRARLLLLSVLLAPPVLAAAYPGPEGFPLAIETMRAREYPGSAITIEQTLRAGGNYKRYVASYRSDGLKIYGLLTVPNGTPPKGGWPAIIFNHGYIPPEVYRTTQRYVAYQDAFARAGFVTFKSDYRGHGSSQGEAEGGYFSPGYTNDVLNATASVRKYKNVNPARIGMWGHSMGGSLTLRSMVIDPGIKAADIWGGVVAPYTDILSKWTRKPGAEPPPRNARGQRQKILGTYGTPAQNPAFYQAIQPNSYLNALAGRPVLIQAGTEDEEVPVAFSRTLAQELKAAGQPVTLVTYPGANHNMSQVLGTALARSVAFFKKNL